MGIAKGKTGNKAVFVVANYSPPGNFGGEYAENVLPPKGLSDGDISSTFELPTYSYKVL